MEVTVDELKQRINIIEHIGSYIPLKKAGRNFKANCPFHNEKTPSFVISPDRQIWHCFGSCHDGGDVIKFMMKWDNVTFYEAVTELARKYGATLKHTGMTDRQAALRERLVSVNSKAQEFFEYVLHKTKFGTKAVEYLTQRGLDERTIKAFHIGYAPSSWDSLSRFLKKKKFTDAEIVSGGLVIASGKGSYDRFRGRIVFPLIDARGVTIGFSGRVLKGESDGAKYINSPETPLYHKRETLYGIHLAKEAIRKEGNAILVEGEFDMITSYKIGIENVVAIKGSAVTKEQLAYLKRFTERITFALDADEAGIEALKKGLEVAETMEFEVLVAPFGFAKDPDVAARTDPVRFKKAVKEAISVYDFLISHLQGKYPATDPFAKKNIGTEIIPIIDRIINPIVRTYYMKKMSSILDITETEIREMAAKMKRKFAPRFERKSLSPVSSGTDRGELIQKYLLSVTFQHSNPHLLFEKLVSTIDITFFSIPSYQKIIKAFIEYKKKHGEKFEANTFLKELPFELQAVFDEVYLYASGDVDLEKENVDKLMHELQRMGLKRLIGKLTSEGEDLDEKKKLKLQKAFEELNEVEKTIVAL